MITQSRSLLYHIFCGGWSFEFILRAPLHYQLKLALQMGTFLDDNGPMLCSRSYVPPSLSLIALKISQYKLVFGDLQCFPYKKGRVAPKNVILFAVLIVALKDTAFLLI